MITWIRSLKYTLVALAVLAGAGAVKAQSVSVPIATWIADTVRPYSAVAAEVASDFHNASVQFVDSSGNPAGTLCTETVGNSFGIPALANLSVPISITYTLETGPSGEIVIVYTAIIAGKTYGGKILTDKSVVGLPGYTGPGSATASGPTGGSNGTMNVDIGGLYFTSTYWVLTASTGASLGTVNIGNFNFLGFE